MAAKEVQSGLIGCVATGAVIMVPETPYFHHSAYTTEMHHVFGGPHSEELGEAQ